MFTQQEAEVFTRDLFLNIYAPGGDKLLKKYYQSDFKEHFLDTLYDLKSLEKDIQLINNNTIEYYVRVESVNVFDDFIHSSCNIIRIDNLNNKVSKTKQVTTWLIQNKKIKESWIINDKSIAEYQEVKLTSNQTNSRVKMFTVEEARDFLQARNKDIFVAGNVDLFEKYYTKDFRGHSSDQIFDGEDIKNRINTLKQYMKDMKVEIEQIMVVGNLITASNKFSCINKITNNVYEMLQFNTFLIEDRKIKESWMILDRGNGLKDINMYTYESAMLPFEINKKNKEEYLKTLDTVLNSEQFNNIKLTSLEKECLYYYLNGFSAKEAAIELNFSPRTIETYLLHIKERFVCQNRFELRKKLFPDAEKNN